MPVSEGQRALECAIDEALSSDTNVHFGVDFPISGEYGEPSLLAELAREAERSLFHEQPS
jgi:hypothetical protein